MSNDVVTRDDKGRFPTGQSGNPAGRPKGTKNHLVQLKQDVEVALREHVSVADLKDVIQNLVTRAKTDNKAAKFVLEFFVSKARDTEDVQDGSTQYVFKIENATFASPVGERTESPTAIQAEFEEVK